MRQEPNSSKQTERHGQCNLHISLYHPNSIYGIYRGTCASIDWVVGLCEMPESWQKGRMSAVFQSFVELLIDLEDDVLPFKLTMEFSRSKLLSA